MPSGKSTLLSALGAREVPIPDHVDIFHLSEEMPASDKTPLQCVMEVDEERCVERCLSELAGVLHVADGVAGMVRVCSVLL